MLLFLALFVFLRRPILKGVGQYVVYRNENENPGNTKHQLGLFSREQKCQNS